MDTQRAQPTTNLRDIRTGCVRGRRQSMPVAGGPGGRCQGIRLGDRRTSVVRGGLASVQRDRLFPLGSNIRDIENGGDLPFRSAEYSLI